MDARFTSATDWFAQMQAELCALLEAVEAETPIARSSMRSSMSPAKFETVKWQRARQNDEDQGGGQMAMMRGGRLIEKAGVHISDVYGALPPELLSQMADDKKGAKFRACGISVIVHPRNPHAAAAHMNTRYIATDRDWFGGGADLTPMLPPYRSQTHEDARDFHAAFKTTCDQHPQVNYDELKTWCDNYFSLPHRDEMRGIGGIFYDDLNSGDWDADFAFTQHVGKTFMEIYPQLLRRRMATEWNDDERIQQEIQRGRYAEFNLLYDRGTQFGLRSGGNVEAILSSLPPVVRWP